jgi:pimeloyl-ACP methyl ester carboxylesterase
MTDFAVTDFSVDVSDTVLGDLRHRLERTKYPDDVDNADWSYGTNATYLRELVDYWLNRYDWRAQERQINAFRHYKTSIDGVPIHFIREPGQGPNPVPLILSHGWPWTFWDLHKVIGPLTNPAAYGGNPEDAFEVIVPSLPGFGYSTPLNKTGINFWRTADIWHTLMTKVLGFERFAAQGGDWGATITMQLGHKYAKDLLGIHLTMVCPLNMFNTERPWDVTGGMLAPPGLTPEQFKDFCAWQRRIASHVAVQVLDPQTLAYGLHDSPAGLLAWLVERRRTWSCPDGNIEAKFSKDHLITTAMIYWVTQSFVTSARYYAEAARHPWRPSDDSAAYVHAPAGISNMLMDGTAGPGFDDRSMFEKIVFTNEHTDGGHFGPAEIPEKIVEDIRATFRPLRGT